MGYHREIRAHTCRNHDTEKSVKVLMDALSKIQVSADLLSEVDFADKRKQPSTALSQEIHSQFGTMLKFAHFDYSKRDCLRSASFAKNCG
jgi:hypothetical protein